MVSNLSCWSPGPGEMGIHRSHTDSWLGSSQQTVKCSWSWTAAGGTSSAAAPAVDYEHLKKIIITISEPHPQSRPLCRLLICCQRRGGAHSTQETSVNYALFTSGLTTAAKANPSQLCGTIWVSAVACCSCSTG